MPPVGNPTATSTAPQLPEAGMPISPMVPPGRVLSSRRTPEAIYGAHEEAGCDEHPCARRAPSTILGEVVEGGGELRHHGGNSRTTKVRLTDGSPDRATALPSWASSWSKAAGWRLMSLRLAAGCVRDSLKQM